MVAYNHLVVRLLAGLMAFGGTALMVAVATENNLAGHGYSLELIATLAIGLLVSGASLLVGGLLGMLFAIPRARVFAPTRNPARERSKKVSRPAFRANTNLEATSDWLTKILIGVAIVTLPRIGSGDYKVPRLIALAGAPEAWSATITGITIVYFGVTGFLGGYLLTRLVMVSNLFSQPDADVQEIGPPKELVQLVARLDERLASMQMNPSLDNFKGEVSARFCDHKGGDLPILESGNVRRSKSMRSHSFQECFAIVTIRSGPDTSNDPFREPLEISDGNDVDTTTFFIAANSEHFDFRPSDRSATFAPYLETPTARFDFRAPGNPGTYDVYFEVSQRNRLIQVVPASLTVQ